MEPLVELPPEAKARIRAREAKATEQSALVKRAFENDLAKANAQWGGYSDLFKEQLHDAIETARAGIDEAARLCAGFVFVAHAQEYRNIPRTPSELKDVLARLREAIIRQYGEHTRSSVECKEAEEMERACAEHTARRSDVVRSAYPEANMGTADFWRDRRAEFDDLKTRQHSILGHPPRDKWLGAYCDFSQEFGEFGKCQIRGGYDGRLISDFEEVATRAACALGCPPGVEPMAFWLYCLGQDLLRASQREIRMEFSPGGEWGGYIQGLLESSAGYCSRLAAKAERQANRVRFQTARLEAAASQDQSAPITSASSASVEFEDRHPHVKVDRADTPQEQNRRNQKKRGRRSNPERTDAIRKAIEKHGEALPSQRTDSGNPVADEILARANDPESMRSLIENGDDSLSPPAQRAIPLARIRMKAESPDALIDIYLSDQWRIHGGPRKKSVREELRDRLIPVVIKAFGSVESSLHVLLKESPCSNGRGIQTFIHACELFFLRIRREALEANDHVKAECFAKLAEEFRELCEFEREYVGTGAGPGEEIHATLRTDVSDTERSSDMVVFGSSSQVTIVRASGTPEELRWDTYMGGDFATTALFQPDDRVVTGDEIYSELFDEPRVVARVVPVLASRQVAYWKATIMPRSEWSRHWPVGPNRIASSTKGATPESEKTATLPRKESQPEPAGGETRGRKGDVTLLKKTDESFYQSVDFPTAETYAGISPRRRQQLMTEGVLTVVGMGQSRRITVESLMAICPPVEDTK